MVVFNYKRLQFGGWKMATIKDVAKLAGVSICTVSRALANKENITPKTMEKVLSAVRELDYKPNYSA